MSQITGGGSVSHALQGLHGLREGGRGGKGEREKRREGEREEEKRKKEIWRGGKHVYKPFLNSSKTTRVHAQCIFACVCVCVHVCGHITF